VEIAQFVRLERWRWLVLLLVPLGAAVGAGLTVVPGPARVEATTTVDVVAPRG